MKMENKNTGIKEISCKDKSLKQNATKLYHD